MALERKMRDKSKDVFFEDNDRVEKKNLRAKRKAALIVLAALIVVSAAAELIINAGKDDTAKVYIQIRCDRVAEATDKLLDPALAEYIPKDGVAMARLKFIAKEGDSVLGILEKICGNNNIEVIKNGDGSVETIGYLKKGDCGEGSGWVYTVNGRLMSENPADCKVSDGDEIVWAFTLNGGEDIEDV